MRKYLFVLLSIALIFSSCEPEFPDTDPNNGGETKPDTTDTVPGGGDVDVDTTYLTYDVLITMKYPAEMKLNPGKDIKIKLTSSTGVNFETCTDENGIAKFNVPTGIYEASVHEKRATEGNIYNLNGIRSGIVVNEKWNAEEIVEIDMIGSKSGQLVIKEIYIGGTQKDDGSGTYNSDQYVILYNNSDQTASIKNFCLGVSGVYNAHSPAHDYVDGRLAYENEDFIPAGNAIWYIPEMTIEPWDEALIAIYGGIDHTLTYSNSVDLSHADYVTYDLEDFDNTYYYSAPSEFIPTDHYFQAYKYGTSNAWVLSVTSPAFFIFSTGDQDPVDFASTPDYFYNGGFEQVDAFRSVKVKKQWIIDAIEIFCKDYAEISKKRLTPDIDAGYTYSISDYGYTSYRNVDKEATEALEGNKEKLVYNYSHGTSVSSDPSDIDAEASIKNGARIIYLDTNNSSNDFHLRNQSSLRD